MFDYLNGWFTGMIICFCGLAAVVLLVEIILNIGKVLLVLGIVAVIAAVVLIVIGYSQK